jgi:molybdate transport system ATP-binding protein
MHFDIDIGKRVVAQGRKFDLSVRFCLDAERLALFGPSGAGKTLTLQLLAGLQRPDRGRIAIDGHVWVDRDNGVDLPTRTRRVGYVFQDYALFPHRTVEQNVAAALSRWLPTKLTQVEQREIDVLLEAFSLTDVRLSYPEQLSGGQRQRTALARAMASRPRLLLLDEPFAALDATLRLRLRTDLIDMQRRFGIPMVLITHDPEDLIQCVDSVISMTQGKVVQEPSAVASMPDVVVRRALQSRKAVVG